MLEVTLSEQYQVVIPKEVCETLHLKVGQKFTVVLKDDLISLVPQHSIDSLRGILKGANTDNIRDHSERV